MMTVSPELAQIATEAAKFATQSADALAKHTFVGVSLREILGTFLQVKDGGVIDTVSRHTFFATSVKEIISGVGAFLGGVFK